MAKLSIDRVEDLRGKRVFVRVDYNVPMAEVDGEMVINDETRIRATLKTLEYLISSGARTILAAHSGRPKGKVEPSMSLKPVAARLSEILNQEVAFATDCVGAEAEQAVASLDDGGVLLLENLRYHASEEANDQEFAGQLAKHADVYINDAFGAAHRAHASTAGVAEILKTQGKPCAAGFLMQRELQFLGEELETPEKPFVVILGGAKVSDKIKVIDRLLEKADTILIGGAMAYTFKLALGHKIGKSLVEPDMTGTALAALEKAKEKKVQFLLPSDNTIADVVETDKLNKKGKPVMAFVNERVNESQDIPDEAEGFDIGPKSVEQYAEVIKSAKTILWNGPMGMFEDERFAKGSYAVAHAVVEATSNGAKSIIGGGDSVKALNNTGLSDKITFASTGGGASLEFLEGKVLPGVSALSDL